jgi:hypothetical protein
MNGEDIVGGKMTEKSRSFTVAGSGTKFEGGRYMSKNGNVMSAARKAGARIYRDLTESQIKLRESKGMKDIKFILKETTRGSKKDTYVYKVKRVLLSKPITRTVAGNTIVSKYSYEITKCGSDGKNLV